MEPAAKRSRKGRAPYDDVDADDELFLEPDDINAQRDPAVQLEQARAAATYKLKSRWEHIFEKYGRDFGDEGDEIDLATGEVVVDNGHIRSLADADDAKAGALSNADEDEEDRILRGKAAGGQQLSRLAPGAPMRDTSYHGQLPGMSASTFGTPRLSAMFSPGVQYPSSLTYGSFRSLGSFISPDRPVDPTWEVPELPIEAYEYSARSNSKIMPRKVIRKTLTAPQGSDGDDDDILLGVTTSKGKEDGVDKQQAGRPAIPAVIPQARLLAAEVPGPSAESTSELVSSAHDRQHDDDSAATTDHILDVPKSSRLPTPPPTDPESDQASGPGELAGEPKWALRPRGRRIEVVIIQHSRKKPPALPDVAHLLNDPVVSETVGDNGEGAIEVDQACRSLAVDNEDCDAMPRTYTAKSSTASKVRRRRGPDIPGRTTATEPTKPGETPDVPVMERTMCARQGRRNQLRAGSSDLRNRPVGDATHSKETTRRSQPDLVSSPLAKKHLDRPRRRTSPADSRAGNESLATEYHRDGDMGIVQDTKTNCAQDEQGLLDEPAPHPESPQLPTGKPATVSEKFARNMIDSTYDFSDEDESFLPRPNKQHSQQGMEGAHMLREVPPQLGGPQALVPEAPPVQVSLSTTQDSPPKGKASRRDGKRLTISPDSGANSRPDAKKPVRQDDATFDMPVASEELRKLVQRAADRPKQVTGQPEERMTFDEPRAPVLEDVSQAQASSFVQAETITTATETRVPVPQALRVIRSVDDQRKRPPQTIVEEGEAPTASHSLEESVVADGPDIDRIPTTEKPVVNPPAPTSKVSRLDSSPSKWGKQPLPSTREEDVRIFDIPLEAHEQQPKTPSHRTTRTPTSRTCPSSSNYSASRLSIISLVSDDEDELSLTLDQISPLKVQAPRKKATPLTVPRPKPSTPGTSVKRLAIDMARIVRLRTKRSRTGWRRSSGVSVGSPAADFVRTPGGTMRACGEDGFKCERDFCFVCL